MTQTRPIVSDLIHQGFNGLTRKERAVAQAILKQYPSLGLETVAVIADKADVSGPTVLRMVQKLGFGSFAGFQSSLREELSAGYTSPLERPSRNTGSDLPAMYASYIETSQHNLRQTHTAIDPEQLTTLLSLLRDTNKRVHLLGGRFTMSLMEYFHRHLHILRPHTRMVPSHQEVWPEVVMDFNAGDMLMIMDVRRYQGDLHRFAEQVKKRGAKIVLITDQWLSPISAIADMVFSLPSAAPSKWDSSLAQLMFLEIIISALTDSQSEGMQERLEALEALREPLQSTLMSRKQARQ